MLVAILSKVGIAVTRFQPSIYPIISIAAEGEVELSIRKTRKTVANEYPRHGIIVLIVWIPRDD